MTSGFLGEMIGKEVKEGKFDKAILVTGMTEWHGEHMPLGADYIAPMALAEEVAKRVDGVLVLPPIPYGFSPHYSTFPFVISIRSETLHNLLLDIFDSLNRNGIKRLLILNGHDGNISIIDNASREFRRRHPEFKIAVLEAWWVEIGALLPKDTFDVWDGLGHGGEGETSLMMAVRPDLVKLEYAKGVVPDLPQHIQIKWNFEELTPYGVTGDPTKASREKGEKIKKALVDLVVSFLKDMDAKNWEYGYKK